MVKTMVPSRTHPRMQKGQARPPSGACTYETPSEGSSSHIRFLNGRVDPILFNTYGVSRTLKHVNIC